MPNVSKEIDIKEGLDDYRSSKDEESSAVDLEANRQDLMRDIQEMIERQNVKKLKKQSKKRVKTLVKFIKKLTKETAFAAKIDDERQQLKMNGACQDNLDKDYETLRRRTRELESRVRELISELTPAEERKLRKKLGLPKKKEFTPIIGLA